MSGSCRRDEEMEESWTAPGDPAVLRQAFAGWDPRIHQLLNEVKVDVPLGALRSRAAADLDQATAQSARRCRASDAAASRTRRQSIDRGRHGARDDPGARGPGERASALLAYERLRRERVAQVQRGARENGLRSTISSIPISV